MSDSPHVVAVIVFVLECGACRRPFAAPVTESVAREVWKAGVPADLVADTIKTALASWQLVCPACERGRAN